LDPGLKKKESHFMNTLTPLLDEKASRIAEQVDDIGRATAGSLHDAASSIRRGSKAIDDLAENAATKLDGAGSYVEKHNVKWAVGESREVVRRYPAESLLLAAGLGFLTGFAIRRLTHACVKSTAQ
jgi:ElaB/YqjD/DUF883 family membrane-anchored ribosome-binding protein